MQPSHRAREDRELRENQKGLLSAQQIGGRRYDLSRGGYLRRLAPEDRYVLLLALRRLGACSGRFQRLPKRPESRLDVGAVGGAIEVLGQAVRVEVQHVRRDTEDFGELINNGILRRVAPVMLEIVQVWRQNLTAILSPKTLCDLFLGQSSLLAGFRDHLAKGLHLDGRLLTNRRFQSECKLALRKSGDRAFVFAPPNIDLITAVYLGTSHGDVPVSRASRKADGEQPEFVEEVCNPHRSVTCNLPVRSSGGARSAE